MERLAGDRLQGKIGLVVGVANAESIGAGCANAFSADGATLILTCRDQRALSYAEPVVQTSGAALLMPMDVQNDNEVDAVFAEIERRYKRLDFLIHSVAYCNKDDLHGRVVDSSRDGFAEAMDISCHSFVRLARKAEPLMKDGGALLTMSFFGAEKVVDNYGVMGPVKAALEASVRYMAAELGGKNIRVNALSPGPIRTRAASGLENVDVLIQNADRLSPLPDLATVDDVGAYARFLVSDDAKSVTGAVAYLDGGYNIMSGTAHA